MKKVIVRFKGGLGNQLFILFYSLYLKKKYSPEIFYDINSGFIRDKVYNRYYQLDELIYRSKVKIFPTIRFNLDLVYIWFFKLFGSNNFLSEKFKILYLSDKNCDIDLSGFKYVMVDGYFHNPYYFLISQEELKPLLKPIHVTQSGEKVLTLHLRFYESSLKYHPDIFVNVLRDYLENGSYSQYTRYVLAEKEINLVLIEKICHSLDFTYICLDSDIEEFYFLFNSNVILNIQSSFSMTAGLLRYVQICKDDTIVDFPFSNYINNFPQSWINFKSL